MHPAAVAKHLASLVWTHQQLHQACYTTLLRIGSNRRRHRERVWYRGAFLVDGVTKLGKHKYRGAERHAESLRRLLVATSADVRVLIIKLCRPLP